MANIVFAWEMGAGLGHTTRIRRLAEILCLKGHSITLILAAPLDVSPNIKVIQAPTWPDTRIKLSREPENLSEVILANGYHNSQKLSQQIKNWQHLLDPLDADLIIFDYAPTAILAARSQRCQKLSLDDPFSKPPDRFPLPAFRLEGDISNDNLKVSDKKLIECVNLALFPLGISPIEAVSEIFQTGQSILLSIPEIDPYTALRTNPEYIGAISSSHSTGKTLKWNSSKNIKKVFAYLKSSYPKLPEFLHSLNQLKTESYLYIPDIDPDLALLYRESNLHISSVPFNLDSEIKNADIIVCHAGHATTFVSVVSGVPLLLIPLQQEQLMTAKQCINHGLAVGLGPNSNANKIDDALQKIFSSEHFKKNALQCQVKYQTLLECSTVELVVQRCEKLLSRVSV